MASEQFTNAAQSTLAAGIAAGTMALTVASATGFPTTGNFRILIDSEILLVTAVAGTTFTVTRAAEPVAGVTAAAAHSTGATVTWVLTAGAVAAALARLDAANAFATAQTFAAAANAFAPLAVAVPGGTTNDFDPGAGTSQLWTPGFGVAPTVTGMKAGVNGELRIIANFGGVGAKLLTFTENDPASAAANRFYLGLGGLSLILDHGGIAVAIYSASSSRWYLGGLLGDQIAALLSAQNVFTNVPNQWYDPSDNILLQVTADANGPSVSVGGETPLASASFEVDGVAKGSVPWPKMTTAQRDAMATARSLGATDEGLVVYNITTHQPNVWNGSAWKTITMS